MTSMKIMILLIFINTYNIMISCFDEKLIYSGHTIMSFPPLTANIQSDRRRNSQLGRN